MIGLLIVLIVVWSLAISWAITVGLIYLITLCFPVNFSLLYATGIWLILLFIKQVFAKGGGDK